MQSPVTASAVATALPFTSLGARLGFVPVPWLFFLILAGMVVAYLAMVQVVKTWFYRRLAAARVCGW